MVDYTPTTPTLDRSVTGTGKTEYIEYQLPPGYNPGGPGHPLLVGWHAYGRTPGSVEALSDYFDEAMAREWVYLAPTAYDPYHFSCQEAHIHTFKAIQYLVETLGINIDVKRIYHVGWSMGAAGALAFASKYLGTGAGRYPAAGVVAVCPIPAMRHSLESGDPGPRVYMPRVFGNTYGMQDLAETLVPWSKLGDFDFNYKRASALWLTPGGVYWTDHSLARNLACGIPIWLTYALDDEYAAHPHHQVQFAQLHGLLNSLGMPYTHDQKATGGHEFDLADATAALDWIDNYSTDDLDESDISFVSDRNDLYFWITLNNAAPGAFPRADAVANVGGNKITISFLYATNMIRIHTDASGIPGSSSTMYFELTHPGGGAMTFVFEDIAIEPTGILDDGSPFTAWSYDAHLQELTINRASTETLDLTISFT